jgi:hypothetical protein
MVGEGANFRGSKFPGMANGDVLGIEPFLVGRHGVCGVTNVLEDDVLAEVHRDRLGFVRAHGVLIGDDSYMRVFEVCPGWLGEHGRHGDENGGQADRGSEEESKAMEHATLRN